MNEDAVVVGLSRRWMAAPEVEASEPPGTATPEILSVSIFYNLLEIIVEGRLAPTGCEWSQLATDIDIYYFVARNNDERNADIVFRQCSFPAATPSCSGWQALLEQLSRIRAHVASLRVDFRNCTFDGEDVRQSIARAVAQMNAVPAVFTNCSVKPAYFQSGKLMNRLQRTEICLADNLLRPFHVWMKYDDGRFEFEITGSQPNVPERPQPTGRQWQIIAALIVNGTIVNDDPLSFYFDDIGFKHSAGLGTFLETLTGLGVNPTTGTIGRRTIVTLNDCDFLDAEAMHSIGTAFASNKAVDVFTLQKIDGQPLCDMIDLLSQSATLGTFEFDIPRNAEHRDCIVRRLAASTSLVSVRMEQHTEGFNNDVMDYSEFIYAVRSAIAATAYQTRGKYREWFVLPVQALPYLCEYVQFGMSRLIVTASSIEYFQELYEETEGSDDLYRLTVLYDMMKSRSAMFQDLGNSSAIVESLPKCGKRNRERGQEA